MPQSNPGPWFKVLVYAWLFFLTIIPTKILNYISPNKPTTTKTKKHKTAFWFWPW
uniref:ATP synthase complex subunit 8 n=1 Tax=Sinocyclocheilus furcodorsalis TaxID=307950 RepID=K9JA01_9TELE|nr:ATP synthase F0 subunit 8 [Sinocyclocheilus furcodorsalis]YP_010585502.1 ATP synthase F0 subunit 8 [Sinocyclocheilus anatirostris]ADD46434.1 ATP synthase F0 subunit 8 [Sinocyclocheilus furcodorsalis]UZX49522.1 ATP synthase F0 subunit 8 [Sinocyclocheilus anatirostris]